MYDLTVEDVHIFAVGEGAWVVHNCGKGEAETEVGRWEDDGGALGGPYAQEALDVQIKEEIYGGLGDLTVEEAMQIQSVADRVGGDSYVVGGVAKGLRDEYSDIDYNAPDRRVWNAITNIYTSKPIDDLPVSGPIGDTHQPGTQPPKRDPLHRPYILFSPGKNPIWVIPRAWSGFDNLQVKPVPGKIIHY
jgi:hypothetical protein